MLGLASCQQDFDGANNLGNSEVDCTLSVALPEDATRATAGADSSKGAIGNVDMNQYDIRYILEVYDENGVLAKDRMTNYSDATSTSFAFRLVPGRAYNFVVWADFVKEQGKDLHYNTADGLRSVKVADGSWTVIDESRDAYTDVITVHNFSSAADIPTITLTRPFAKLRVVTNDIKQMISVRPAEVKVNYFSTKFYDAFDAFAEKASNLVDAPANLTVTLLDAQKNPDEDYTGEKPEETGVQTLFADYFFGAENDRVMFTMDVKDNSGRDIPQVTFNTNIPVNRNKLTTVLGPILTDSNNITVTIDDAFAGYNDINTETDTVAVTVANELEFNEAFEDENIDVIVLTDDIVLDSSLTRAGDYTLTVSNGKKLTIDLNGKKLSATSTQSGKNYDMILVKGNLTVKNGTITIQHTGTDMEWSAMTTIFDITAGGAVNLDGVTAKNLGGSAMAFVAHLNNWGDATLNVDNSTLESTYIAVRAFNSGNDMNNITIKNSTINGKYCFWVHNYKTAGDSKGTDATLNVSIFGNNNTFEYTGIAPVLYGFNEPLYFDEYGTEIVFNAERLAANLTADKENVSVILGANIDVPINSLGQMTGGSGEYKLGGENTKAINIDLNDNKLNITTTYWSAIGAKNNDALFTIKNGTMTSTGNSAGTWNAWDVRLSNCNYAIEDVVFEKAVALDNAGKAVTMKNVTITDTHNTDTYGLWITAEGQTVTLDGCTIDMTPATDGRGIKIDNQYVAEADQKKVTLNVAGTTFKTEEKSAVLVKSVAGAEINWGEGNNISEVAGDTDFAVWVDEDAAAYADKVVVNGADKKVEGANDKITIVTTASELQTALDNAVEGNNVIRFGADITGDVTITQKKGVNVTIDGNSKKFNGVMTTFGKGRDETRTETLVIKNINFAAKSGAASCIVSPDRTANNSYSYSHNVTVENCTFTDGDGAVNCAAVRHEDGGDKNWTIKDCTIDNTMHSILQVNNIEGKLTIVNCTVLSKNGANLNSCTNVEMNKCTFDVLGYALRFGVNSGGNLGVAKDFVVNDSSLKSACNDGDAVIMFRASAVDAVLTLNNTTLTGTTEISGNTAATTINRN